MTCRIKLEDRELFVYCQNDASIILEFYKRIKELEHQINMLKTDYGYLIYHVDSLRDALAATEELWSMLPFDSGADIDKIANKVRMKVYSTLASTSSLVISANEKT